MSNTYGQKKFDKNSISAKIHKIAKTCSIKPIVDNNGKYSCVYVIRHSRSGCYYIGVHTDDQPNSILKTYMTSSKVVHAIMESDGIESFVVENILYFKTRSDANYIENILIKNNYPMDNKFLLNKMFDKISRNGYGDKHITAWETQLYRGKLIAVNPECKILDESYQYKNTYSYCEYPDNLYRKPNEDYSNRPAIIVKKQS